LGTSAQFKTGRVHMRGQCMESAVGHTAKAAGARSARNYKQAGLRVGIVGASAFGGPGGGGGGYLGWVTGGEWEAPV
jgi:hypothetical protein